MSTLTAEQHSSGTQGWACFSESLFQCYMARYCTINQNVQRPVCQYGNFNF